MKYNYGIVIGWLYINELKFYNHENNHLFSRRNFTAFPFRKC